MSEQGDKDREIREQRRKQQRNAYIGSDAWQERLSEARAEKATETEQTYTVSQIAAMLRFLGKARGDYTFETPEDMGDIQRIGRERVTDLLLWNESETATKLAAYFEDPDSAWGWLPSWREPEWKALVESFQGEK